MSPWPVRMVSRWRLTRSYLSSSSPFFLNLLRRNKHQHPLIYMRGLKSEDLVAMIDFLYCGEANVYQENLDSFLAVAEELQLKGLMGSGAEKKVEDNMKRQNPRNIIQKHNQPNKQLFSQVQTYLILCIKLKLRPI